MPLSHEEVRKFLTAFQSQAWNLDYDGFREITNLADNDYAIAKFKALRDTDMALTRLGDFIYPLLEEYEREAAPANPE